MTAPVPYTPPTFKADGFNCLFCHAYTDQRWGNPHLITASQNHGQDDAFWMCRCARCKKWSIWVGQKLVFPLAKTAPIPNADIPTDIQQDYEEAREIHSQSPRGSAALLRLCIQKLCKHLGQPGKNINSDIGALVNDGLSSKVQKSLDIVRVVGNNAVHPGQIDLRDDLDTANKLFGLVNLIADVMITQPKHVDEMFNSVVPESQKDAIAKRDGT